MMTERPADVPVRYLFMKAVDDYIPVELWREAKGFVQNITDDVEIYKKIRILENFHQNEEADKFIAWWDFKRYQDKQHSLFLIYENIENITLCVGKYDVMNGFYQLQHKMILLYRLLRQNGMINE